MSPNPEGQTTLKYRATQLLRSRSGVLEMQLQIWRVKVKILAGANFFRFLCCYKLFLQGPGALRIISEESIR